MWLSRGGRSSRRGSRMPRGGANNRFSGPSNTHVRTSPELWLEEPGQVYLEDNCYSFLDTINKVILDSACSTIICRRDWFQVLTESLHDTCNVCLKHKKKKTKPVLRLPMSTT